MMHESYKKWLNDGKPKVICDCGCNNEIIIKDYCYWKGIPKYIHGHHPMSKETKQKIREVNLGKHETEETKQKIRESRLGKHQTEETKQKIRENRPNINGENNPMYGKYGDKNPAWKGGITPLIQSIRNFNEYKEWRLQIFGRDNFTCQCCGIRGVYLEVHHIKSFSKIIREYNIKNIEDALNCELLWDLNNGITYCLECHNKLKKKGGLL